MQKKKKDFQYLETLKSFSLKRVFLLHVQNFKKKMKTLFNENLNQNDHAPTFSG